MTKVCTGCGVDTPLSEFDNHKGAADGKASWCKECRRAKNRAYREKHREAHLAYMRDLNLMWKYKLTRAAYDELLAAQGGVCRSCGGPPGKRGFHIDHDHSCCPGQKTCGACIRGIVCHRCNTVMGFVRDDPAVLEQISKYLSSSKQAHEGA